MFGYMHISCTDMPIFQLIDCITPNSELSCILYAYISCLRYQPLKFDLPLIIVEIWLDLSKVASATSEGSHIVCVTQGNEIIILLAITILIHL